MKRVRQFITDAPGLSESLQAETLGREHILLSKFGLADG